MKKSIRINYVFWKKGSLLFDLAHIVPTLAPHASAGVFFGESKLPRLLNESNTGLKT